MFKISLKISETAFNEMDIVTKKARSCFNSVHCMWSRLKDDFCKTSEKCPVSQFREILEQQSPVFYCFLKEASGYEKTVGGDYMTIMLEGDPFQKTEIKQRLSEPLSDLHLFTELSLEFSVPLHYANYRCIPNISKEFIYESAKGFNPDCFAADLKEVYPVWADLLDNYSCNFKGRKFRFYIFLFLMVLLTAINKEWQEAETNIFREVSDLLSNKA